jgi:hypothetical protein
MKIIWLIAWRHVNIQQVFQCMTPILLDTANAINTFTPPSGLAKLDFKMGPPKASRSLHNKSVEAHLWLWPHAPP